MAKGSERTSRSARPPLLALRSVGLKDGSVMLFDGADLSLSKGSRACLVGRNGAGKSTLLRLIAGEVVADEGDRFLQPGTRIAFVPQEPRLSGPRLLDHAAAGGAQEHLAAAELEAFGLDPNRTVEGLSGGEVRRCALARAFAETPDLLLLDEPTNHLDILAIETLERRILGSRAAVLTVSHDRRFLERVTERCFWLAHRRIRALDAGFAAFDAFQERAEAEEDERLRRLQKAIERETYTFHRSITAQRTRNEGRARALQTLRTERAALLADRTRTMEMAFLAGALSGRLVIEAEHLSKAYGGRRLLSDFSTRIFRGDRVAIVGRNGAGKTSLVRLLLGETAPDGGRVRLGSGLSVLHLDQSRAGLKDEETLMEALTPSGGDSLTVQGRSVHAAAYARDFLFRDEQLRQPVGSLSGGERNRLLLARGLARPANLLVLDEPTNDLDMETLELLEDRLSDYEGTLLLVSHDRDFIDRLATSTIALDGRGGALETPGGYSDLVEQNPSWAAGLEAARSASLGSIPRPDAAEKTPPVRARTPSKLTFKDQRRLEACELELAELPERIAALERRLADPGLFGRDPTAFAAAAEGLQAARSCLDQAETDWLRLETLRSELEAARGSD